MPARVVVGVQWGDEGKGKIIDILASRADVVVRSQGGNNAGHTVENGGEVYKLQLIRPASSIRTRSACLAAALSSTPKVSWERSTALKRGEFPVKTCVSIRARMLSCRGIWRSTV